jgi:hypothetical protein
MLRLVMSQSQASGGSCQYGQFLADRPAYDNQVRKPRRKKKKKGEK